MCQKFSNLGKDRLHLTREPEDKKELHRKFPPQSLLVIPIVSPKRVQLLLNSVNREIHWLKPPPLFPYGNQRCSPDWHGLVFSHTHSRQIGLGLLKKTFQM